jgi:hypothetical protein
MPIQALLDFYVGTRIADFIGVGKQLQVSLVVLHSVVPGDPPTLLETKDTIRVRLRAYWPIGLFWLSCWHTEALVKTR